MLFVQVTTQNSLLGFRPKTDGFIEEKSGDFLSIREPGKRSLTRVGDQTSHSKSKKREALAGASGQKVCRDQIEHILYQALTKQAHNFLDWNST